jgi:hypothetical protein
MPLLTQPLVENGVEIIAVETMHGIDITVKHGERSAARSHTWRHEPIFGYDVEDMAEVDRIINELKTLVTQ